MTSEDRYFSVTSSVDYLNVRSSAEFRGKENDLGGFNLKTGDVIHAIDTVVSGGITFHKFDRIYRGGTRFDHPFDGFPLREVSLTGEYWAADKGSGVWMIETKDPELSLQKPPIIITDVDHQPTSTKKYVGWRVLHKDEEGGYDKTPDGMPEVIPPENPVALAMSEKIQWISFKLMRHFNKDITEQLWTKIHDHDRAFTNFNGFNKDSDRRANFITSKDTSKPLPKYDKMGRLCGGMFVHGEVRGDKLVCRPGIDGIDSDNLPKDITDEYIQKIVDKNWYFLAISYYKKGSVGHFPQGKGGPVAIPFIFNREIQFPKDLFVRWLDDVLPDPTKLYNKEA